MNQFFRDKILWRTRGFDWDYRFLSKPNLKFDLWLDLFDSVFTDSVQGDIWYNDKEFYDIRKFTLESGIWFFHCLALKDPIRSDRAHRRIMHFFIQPYPIKLESLAWISEIKSHAFDIHSKIYDKECNSTNCEFLRVNNLL